MVNIKQLPVYLQVAHFVAAHPHGVGRSDVATHFVVGKTTAAYHLDKCVKHGLLARNWTWVSRNSSGWVYFGPSEDNSILSIASEEYAARMGGNENA